MANACTDCEPYNIEYTEKEAYIDSVAEKKELEYSFVNTGVEIRREGGAVLLGVNPRIVASALIKNTDEFDGVFSFTVLLSFGGERLQLFGKTSIKAGETETISASTEITPYTHEAAEFANVSVVEKEIIPPTVIKKHAETKYRDVTKIRKCAPCDENCEKYKRVSSN